MGNRQLHGTSIAPGLAIGEAFVYRDVLEQSPQQGHIAPDKVDAEYERVRRAADDVLSDLDESARRVGEQIGPYEAEIFNVHRMMLQDLLGSGQIRDEIEAELVDAEGAVRRVIQRWAERMNVQESTRFMERAQDVEDLGRQLLRKLKGVSVHPLEQMPEGAILVAPRLLASDAVFFARGGAAAVVTEFGTAGSHCALMTRHVGIPGVCDIPGVADTIQTGDTVLVDGFRSSVVVEPDETTRQKFDQQVQAYHRRWAKALSRCEAPAVTEEGVRIPVMANIANRADADVAAQNGADGVGLYRLEALFMLRRRLPTEEELFNEVSATLAPMRDKPAIVRLLDVGSDKDLPYLELAAEPAPCLGRRGVRMLLAHSDLLKVQVRALLRLSQTRDIQIMVPMVTVAEDMEAVRQAVESEAADLEIDAVPPLVAMIETPAAALSVPAILEHADALSLGTNDLTQYTMAAGRQNPLVIRYFQDSHPAVLRLIRLTTREAGDVPVAVCGELAGQPYAVKTLLDAGVRLLSVAPPLVPPIKEAVRHPPVPQPDRPGGEESPTLG